MMEIKYPADLDTLKDHDSCRKQKPKVIGIFCI